MTDKAQDKHVFTWEAEGILSGDCESFCLAATKEECLRSLRETNGDKYRDDEYLSENPFHEGLFNLYPVSIPRRQFNDKKVRYNLRIEIEVLDEPA